jgi:hypothetical protein
MIDWKNWKNGAIIGLVYGIIGLSYFFFLLWFNSQPNSPGQPIIDSSSGIGIMLFLIGVLVFLPLCFFSYITGMIFSSFIPANSIISISIAVMPIYGTLLGALIGHFFGKRDKEKENAGQ